MSLDLNIVKDKINISIEPTNVPMNDFTAKIIEVGADLLKRQYLDDILEPLKS